MTANKEYSETEQACLDLIREAGADGLPIRDLPPKMQGALGKFKDAVTIYRREDPTATVSVGSRKFGGTKRTKWVKIKEGDE